MEVIVDVEEKYFGEDVSKRTVENVAQDIIDRFCNPNYFITDVLNDIKTNQF